MRSDFPFLSSLSYTSFPFGSIWCFSLVGAIIKNYLLNLYNCNKNLLLLNSFYIFVLQLTVTDNILPEVKVMELFVPNTLKIIKSFERYLPFQSWIGILGNCDFFEKVNKKFVYNR